MLIEFIELYVDLVYGGMVIIIWDDWCDIINFFYIEIKRVIVVDKEIKERKEFFRDV